MTTKEAQIALANLKRYISGGGAIDGDTNEAINMAIKALSEPEPKKGEWKYVEPEPEYIKAVDMVIKVLKEPKCKKGKWIRDAVWFTRYYCSQCGEKTEDTIMGEPRYRWCPMCGADMRGEKDG